MRFVDEYRDGEAVRQAAAAIASVQTRAWTLMEICGGQTHSILKFGLDQLLPENLTLVHGPGCPVCVTPLELIDQAVDIAARKEVIFTSFGDMLRVPGSKKSLLQVKSEGGDVRIVYSPLDAVKLAEDNPARQVVFFAVGFETTAPANAMAVWRAHELGLPNFTVLCSHVLVPPAIDAILSAPDCRIQGFLAAGHVCTVEGQRRLRAAGREVRRPHRGHRLRTGGSDDGNPRLRAGAREGNGHGRERLQALGQPRGQPARARSGAAGLRDLRPGLARDRGHSQERTRACARSSRPWTPPVASTPDTSAPKSRRSASRARFFSVTSGPPNARPSESKCTPDHPLGAPMVSAEGACAAYHAYRRSA